MLEKYQTLLALGLVVSLSGQSLAARTDLTSWSSAAAGFSPVSSSSPDPVAPGSDILPPGILPSGILPAPAMDSAALRLAQSSIVGSYDFTWNAVKQDDVIELSGNVPSEQIATFLDIRAGKNSTGSLSVGRGAPETFISSAIVALDALKRLEGGFATLEEGRWTIEGLAADPGVRQEVLDLLSAAVEAEDWNIMIFLPPSEAEVALPELPQDMAATPYSWSARINEDGALELDGFVPSEGLGSFLETRALDVARNEMQVRPDAPAGYARSAVAAIAALRELGNGRVQMIDGDWTLSALARSPEQLGQVLASLAGGADGDRWTFDLGVAPPAEIATDTTTAKEESGVGEAQDAGAATASQPEAEEAQAASQTASLNMDYQFNAFRADDGPVTLSGTTPTRAFADYLARVVGAPSSQSLGVDGDAPADFRISAMTGVKALSRLSSGLLAYENGGWTLVGDALNDEIAAQVWDMIAGLEGGTDWQVDIALVPAFELCSRAVARFSDTHIILFAPASAQLTAESARDVAELAQDLNACPGTRVYVAGHTDSDGPADANMALSVARAEAVISQLVASGVDPLRLYAVGYGETLPIASNETRAGKAMNRRIVFELEKE